MFVETDPASSLGPPIRSRVLTISKSNTGNRQNLRTALESHFPDEPDSEVDEAARVNSKLDKQL